MSEGLSPEEIEAIVDNIPVEIIDWEHSGIIETTLAEIGNEDLAKALVEFGGLSDPIGQLQSWLAQQLAWVVDSIVTAVGNLLAPIREAIDTLTQSINNIISQITQSIEDAFNSVAKTFQETFTNFYNMLSNLLGQILSDINELTVKLSGIIQSLPSMFESITSAISSLTQTLNQVVIQPIVDFITHIPEYAQQIAQQFQNAIQTYIINPLMSAIQSIIQTIQNIPSIIGETISGLQTAIGNVINYVSEIINQYVVQPLQGLIDYVSTALSGVQSAVQSIVQSIYEIPQTLQTTINMIIGTLQTGIQNIISQLEPLLKPVVETIGNIYDAVKSVTEKVGEEISKIVPQLTDVVNQIVQSLQNIGENIKKTFESAIEYIEETIENFPQELPKFVANVEQWVWEKLPEWVRKFLEEAPKSLSQVATTFQGFINAILQFPNWFPQWFEEKIAKPIADAITSVWEKIPEPFKPIISPLGALLDWGYTFITNPEKFAEQMMSAVNQIKGFFDIAQNTIKDYFLGFAKSLIDWLGKIGGSIAEMFSGAINTLAGGLKGVSENIGMAISWIATDFFKRATKPLSEYIGKAFQEAFSGKRGEIEVIFGLGLTLTPIFISSLMLPTIFKSLAHFIKENKLELSFALQPLGIGMQGSLSLLTRLSRFLYEFGKRLEILPEKMAESVILGFTLVGFEPLRYPMRYLWKSELRTFGLGDIPFDLPATAYVIRTARMKGLVESVEAVDKILTYRGYPDWIVKGFTKGVTVPDEIKKIIDKKTAGDFLQIVDRFGNIRKIPTSPLFFYPTESDITRFMIRDMFKEGEEFANYITWIYRVGIHPDVAVFYYLLHFRYPPVEKLWSFVVRGISGLLWYEPTKEEMALAQEESSWLKAFMPKPPAELNATSPEKATKLFEALGRYMKWYDYARFSWIPEFTSDNMLMIDTLADMPTKIDQRWMVRWGIYEVMADKIFGGRFDLGKFQSLKIRDIRETMVSATPPKTKITLDLSLFGKTLQATGLHPDWIPIVTVAETINTLTDERTLLRTGFINLYKEGFWTIDDLEELMSGFFKAGFHVAYFNIKDKKWYDGWIELPIMFLPPERKLLELRATFDRALDLLRDYMRATYTGARDLVLKPEDITKRVKDFVNLMNEQYFEGEVEKISGVPRKLKVDEKWLNIYVEYVKHLRDIYTVVRARYYSRYLFWRLIYRFERGFISLQEMKDLIGKVVDKIRESPLVKEILELVAETMLDAYTRQVKADAIISKFSKGAMKYGEALEELKKLGVTEEIATALLEAKAKTYVPTVLTIGTMAELVPEAINLLPEIFEIRGVPKHHRPYWEKYVKRKVIKDDFNYLKTAIRKAIAKGIPVDTKILQKLMEESANLWKNLKDFLEPYGVTQEEFALWYIAERLVVKEEAVKEYIPTPLTLATMSEIIPIPEKLIQEVFEIRNVPENWRKIWQQYIEIKPISDDVKALANDYLRAIVGNYITDDLKKKIESLLLSTTYREKELDILKLRAELRKLDTWVPTALEVVTIAEYVPEARQKLDQVFKRRNIDPEWQPILRKYVRIRPWMDELRRLVTEYITDYARGTISKADFEWFLKKLKDFGYEDEELDMIRAIAELRKRRYQLSGE